MAARDYDSTVSRIAGNILGGYPESWLSDKCRVHGVKAAVATARMIIEETKRTEPAKAEAVSP